MDSGISNKRIIKRIEKLFKHTGLWIMREAEVTFPEGVSKRIESY